MRSLRAQSRFAVWAAPLWILALAGLLFLPTQYRGGAEAPHSHALLHLLLDARDGNIAHTHARPTSAGSALDWLDPIVPDQAAAGAQGGSLASEADAGQQDRAPVVSIITFLVAMPVMRTLSGAMPRISHATRRLLGRTPRVLSPPPRLAYAGI